MSFYIAGSRDTDADPEVIWGLLADVDRWADTFTPYLTETRLDGPLAVGSVGWVRTSFPPVRSRWKIIYVDEGRAWAWTGRVLWLDVTYHHIIEEHDAICRVLFKVEADGVGSELAARALRKTNLTQMRKALDLLVELAEARTDRQSRN